MDFKDNEGGQWIIILGFAVSIILIFLAIVVNESALVGKTTAESVLEFPKADLYNIRHAVERMSANTNAIDDNWINTRISDIQTFYLEKKGLYLKISSSPVWVYNGNYRNYTIHYNNGVIQYTEYLNYTRVGTW